MRYIWTHERGSDLALRDAKHCPRLLVGHPKDGKGYVCCIFEAGDVSGGPFKSRLTACRFGEDWIRANLDPEAIFSDVPEYVFANSGAVKKRREKAKQEAFILT